MKKSARSPFRSMPWVLLLVAPLTLSGCSDEKSSSSPSDSSSRGGVSGSSNGVQPGSGLAGTLASSGSGATQIDFGSGGTTSSSGSGATQADFGSGGTTLSSGSGATTAASSSGGTVSSSTDGGVTTGGANATNATATGGASSSTAGTAAAGATAGVGGVDPGILGAAPRSLTVNGIGAALDLDVAPRFGWHVTSAEQTAYEIQVSSTLANAEAGTSDVWTTGKVTSAQQNDIRYSGPALATAKRFFWRVRTWDSRGEVSQWSSVATFGTGPGKSWSNSMPIWASSVGENWTDYTLTAQLTIDEVALGIRFRSLDTKNGYMWQFRGSDNRLVAHRVVNGAYSIIQSLSLPTGTLAVGTQVEVRIEAIASTIRTYVNGVLVNTLVDSMFPRGGIGVRTGNSESGTLASLSLADSNGAVLLKTDFNDGDRTISCGTVTSGALKVPKASDCLNSGQNADWVFLRKDVTLSKKPIAWATAYATGTSHLPARQYVYKLYVNGRFVGLGPTHSIASETRYDGFDVTELLSTDSANSLAAVAYTTSGQKFQAELVVEFTDGSREILGTDSTWKALPGACAFPSAGSIGTSYYSAPKENLDARCFPYGFDAPGFDDSTWQAASEKSAIGELAAAPMAKVEEQLRAPVSIVEIAAGHYFVDFGRTWVGGVKYDVLSGTAGNTVEVRFGEVTSAANTVRYQLSTGNTYQDVYTMRGGSQTFRTWGMRVFRYVEIIGAPEPITVDNLKALALVYPFDAAATFTASDVNLQSVWQLSKNTIEALNVNFYTDSWTRERADYEADAYLQLLSTLYLANDLSLGRYSIDYFKSNRTWPTEWPLYVILAVHDAWRQTGETQQLRDAYASLKTKLPDAWFDEQTQLIRKSTGSSGCSSTTDCDIVDWPQSQRDGFVFQQYNTVVNALSYRAYRDMAEIAAAIGETGDATIFATRANALRAAINSRLYTSSSGKYVDGMDGSGTLVDHYALHSSAFALAFGVPEEAEAPRVADYVASRGMACSVYCAAFLINGLYSAEHGQAALNLLTSTEVSSWMNMIRLGAGSTAEAWDPSMKSNLTYSHPWAASPAFLVPSGLFGIQPLEAGYARFQVKPRSGDLASASVTVPTVRGTIGAAFDYGFDGTFQLAVEIPGNTKADLSLPVKEGTTAVYVNGVAYAVQPQNGYVTVPALSTGCQVVSTNAGSQARDDKSLLSVCASAPVFAN